MPATTTLADLRAQFRYRTQTTTNDPPDAVVDSWVVDGYRAMYDEMLNTGTDYVPWDSTLIATTPGTPGYVLPTNFYRLRGVTIEFGPYRHKAIYQIPWAERTLYENAIGWGYAAGYGWASRIGYTLLQKTGTAQAQIVFMPTPDGAYNVRVDYYKLPVVPVLSTDAIDTGNGWQEFLLAHACAKFAITEETDARGWIEEREQARARLLASAVSRNETEPAVATDVESISGNPGGYRWAY